MASRKSSGTLGTALRNARNLKDPELERWAKAMVDLRAEEDEVPDGWYTTDELADKLGLTASGIRPYIQNLRKRGDIEETKFKRWIKGRNERRYSITYYRLK